MEIKGLHYEQYYLVCEEVYEAHYRLVLVVYLQVLGPKEEVVFEVFFVYEGLRGVQPHLAIDSRTVALGPYRYQGVGLLLAERTVVCVGIACDIAEVDAVALPLDEHEVSALVNKEDGPVGSEPVTPHVVPAVEQIDLGLLHPDLNMEQHMAAILLLVFL